MRRGRGLGMKRIAALLLVLGLPLAWIANNGPWADAAARPTPPELQLRPVQVAPEANAFVVLTAPNEAAGDPRWPEGPLWNCRPQGENCVARWLAEPAALREALQVAAPIGERCERAAQALAYEEVVAERPASGPAAAQPYANLPTPIVRGLNRCVAWFGMQAAASATPAEALGAAARADRLARMALAGSRSLIATQVAASAVEHAWLQAAALVAAGRFDRRELGGLLAPLPPAALSPRLWVSHEARFAREVTRDLVNPAIGCGSSTFASADRGWLDDLVCRFGLGLLPEQTAQDIDARWAARLALVPAEGPAPCERLDDPPWRETGRFWPAWRNSIGRWLLDVPGVDWGVYAARQLDLELLRQTLAAQALGQSPPGAVSLTREDGALRFAACRARRGPGNAEATLKLPLI